jgi:hypothetical protein
MFLIAKSAIPKNTAIQAVEQMLEQEEFFGQIRYRKC